jgi:cell division transport system permease protein
LSAFATRRQALARAGQLAARGPGVFLLGVLLAAAAVLLPLATWLLAQAAEPLVARVQAGPQASVFVALGTPAGEVNALQARIDTVPGVAQSTLIPRDDALAELTRRSGLSASLGELKNNPLPDTLVVQLRADDPATLDGTVQAIRKLARVDSVQFDAAWYRNARALLRIARAVAFVVAAWGVLLLVLLLVSAVRLQMDTSAREARALRLVGAEPGFIVRPFAYLGALTLVLGGALALGIVAAGQALAGPALAAASKALGVDVALTRIDAPVVAVTLAACLLVGWLVALVAARSALRRLQP